jgi:hypothetical protein
LAKKTRLAGPLAVAQHPVCLTGPSKGLATVFALAYQPEIYVLWQGVRCRLFVFHSPTGNFEPYNIMTFRKYGKNQGFSLLLPDMGYFQLTHLFERITRCYLYLNNAQFVRDRLKSLFGKWEHPYLRRNQACGHSVFRLGASAPRNKRCICGSYLYN